VLTNERNAVSSSPPARVLIVGGGLAGLAAAVSLAGRGLKLTLVESRPRLGGRASSFIDPSTGELVDNCQHVSMSCCTNLADFCQRVGIAQLFRREEEVVFLSPEGRISRLRARFFPAPFHLTLGFLRANYLTWIEKLRVAYGMACLRSGRGDRPGESFADWLMRHGQTARTLERYWATVLVSALNERLDQMDVGHARKVFLDGFLRNREGYVVQLPMAPLGDLYGVRLETWLREHGIDLRMTTGVRELLADDAGEISGATLRNGEKLEADFVVLAVPFDRVRAIIPESLSAKMPQLEALDAMKSSPITGVHLWYDRSVCPFDHVAVVGRVIQWVFNHSAIQQGEDQERAGEYLQIVISAAYDLQRLGKEAILDLVRAELAELWPASSEAQLLRSWVVTEHGATFAVRPGIDSLRPPQRTSVKGLFLAGDWTDTGWPATMEGAVRSGYLAAEHLLRDLGVVDQLVRPDLPPGRLARWLVPEGRANRTESGPGTGSGGAGTSVPDGSNHVTTDMAATR